MYVQKNGCMDEINILMSEAIHPHFLSYIVNFKTTPPASILSAATNLPSARGWPPQPV